MIVANCHHDLTVLPDGKIACLSWIQQSGDRPSDLLESDYQGNVKKVMTLDSKVYAGGTGLGGGSGTYHAPGTTSSVLGDVQRLPNGNTLVTFSIAGTMDEIDASGSVVQHISGPGGYADWRETLYGPPLRF